MTNSPVEEGLLVLKWEPLLHFDLVTSGNAGRTPLHVHLSCSVTLEKKGTLFGAWTIFSGAATKKKEKSLVPLNN